MAVFKDIILKLRTEKEFSQEQLAKELNISKSTIGMWETGSRLPSPEKFEEIADYFNVDLDYLYGRSPIRKKVHFDNDGNKYVPADLLTGTNKIREYLTPTSMIIHFIDEPEVYLHSKAAYELVKKMIKMSDEDLEFLTNTAERISPNKKMPTSSNITNKNVSDDNSSNAQPFTTVEEAKKYLESLGKSVAAFGGGSDISDKSIIEMANIIYKDKNK